MEQNALEKLKAMGAEKIREATKLDLGRIEDILEKRFEKIAPVRAKGFISMLEKEFSLDLSSWLEEYHQFQAQKNGSKEKQKPQHSQEQNHTWFWVACVGLLIVGGGLLYWISSQTPQSTSPQPLKSLQTQEEAVEIIPSQESVEQEGVVVEEEVDKIAPMQEVRKEPSEYGESIFPQIPYNEENILFITANSPLWVGIINLDTQKRVSKTKKEFEIPLDKQLLINIARGGFSVSLDDEEKVFGGYKPIYLIHTKEGGLKEITKEEFVLLNGGVEW